MFQLINHQSSNVNSSLWITNQETSRMRSPWPALGRSATGQIITLFTIVFIIILHYNGDILPKERTCRRVNLRNLTYDTTPLILVSRKLIAALRQQNPWQLLWEAKVAFPSIWSERRAGCVLDSHMTKQLFFFPPILE
jgi:hypothetical protein